MALSVAQRKVIAEYILGDGSAKSIVETFDDVAEAVDSGRSSYDEIETFIERCKEHVLQAIEAGELTSA